MPQSGDDAQTSAATPTVGTAIPIEFGPRAGGWIGRCAATLLQVLGKPTTTFATCPEPIEHGRALGYLATLRLPAWVLLITYLGLQYAQADGPEPVPTRAIHAFVDPALTEALSAWLALMVPVGMPLLYFLGGLIAHIGMALTGGASRSIGASMRAVGYALGGPLLLIALLDLPLYTVGLPGIVYLAVVGAVVLMFLHIAAVALTRTHQTVLARGYLVALLPTVLLLAVTVARAVLQLDSVPGLPEPSSPYWVP